nr:paired amphipathic helix protein Sin3-like 2 [Tanacetum cinerariifolium]
MEQDKQTKRQLLSVKVFEGGSAVDEDGSGGGAVEEDGGGGGGGGGMEEEGWLSYHNECLPFSLAVDSFVSTVHGVMILASWLTQAAIADMQEVGVGHVQAKNVAAYEKESIPSEPELCIKNVDRVYKSFLNILIVYRKQHKGINEVYREVAALFNGQPGLLDEFTIFFPDASAAASAHCGSLARPSNNHNDEKSSALAPVK